MRCAFNISEFRVIGKIWVVWTIILFPSWVLSMLAVVFKLAGVFFWCICFESQQQLCEHTVALFQIAVSTSHCGVTKSALCILVTPHRGVLGAS